MGPAVRIRGLRETQRAFKRMSGAVGPTLREGLRGAAEPVAREARMRVGQYAGAKTSTIGPRVTLSSVKVTQRARKVTGLRPDFGALQMTRAFIPALEHNTETVQRAASEALESVEQLGGF